MSIDPRTIETKKHFIAFMDELRSDLKQSPEQFENTTLGAFLEALSSWVADSDGYYRNAEEPAPPSTVWRYLADALSGGLVYE